MTLFNCTFDLNLYNKEKGSTAYRVSSFAEIMLLETLHEYWGTNIYFTPVYDVGECVLVRQKVLYWSGQFRLSCWILRFSSMIWFSKQSLL